MNQGTYLDSGLETGDSHVAGVDAAALDLDIDLGTSVLAMAEGHIVDVVDTRNPESSGTDGFGNYVTVRHTAIPVGGGDPIIFYATYAHLDKSSLKWIKFAHDLWTSYNLEMPVHTGDTLGTVGNAGYGIHLHVQFSTATTVVSGGGTIADGTETAANTALLKSLMFAGSIIGPGGIRVSDLDAGYWLTSINKDTGEVPGQYSPDGVGGGGNPDLSISSVALGSVGASPGSNIDLAFSVLNIGDVSSSSVAAEIIASANSDFSGTVHILDEFIVGGLDAAGGSDSMQHFSKTVSLPTSLGRTTYYIGVRVDTEDEVAELNEENNYSAPTSLAVGGGLSGDPDLRVGSITGSGVFHPGAEVPVSFTISADNDGAPPYSFGVYYSDDETLGSDDVLIYSTTTDRGLGFQGVHYYNLNVTIPDDAKIGAGYIFVRADPENALIEQKEDNNVRSEELTISRDVADSDALPDLFADELSIDSVIQAGSLFRYAPQVINISADDSVPIGTYSDGTYAFKEALLMSVDPIFSADDRVIYISKQGSLSAGQISGGATILTMPTDVASGLYYFGVAADWDRQISEENEFNNITAAALVEIINNIPPSVDAVNDDIRLTNVSKTIGNVFSNDVFEVLSTPVVDSVQGNASLVGIETTLTSGARITIRADGSYILDADSVLSAMTVGTTIVDSVTYRARGVNGDVDTATIQLTIERLDPNIGTLGKDVLLGSSWNDYIDGLAGNDQIEGLAGNDDLFGGTGKDRLFGGEGNDRLTGGIGNDRVDGGAGSDFASFTGTVAAFVNLSLNGEQNTGHGLDILVSIEHIRSGSGNDRLFGNGLNNKLYGGKGSDTINGGAGDDFLVGGKDGDSLAGGEGEDTFDYNDISDSGVTKSTRDRLIGFFQTDDIIDLSTMDADATLSGNQAFSFIFAAAFTGEAGELRAVAGVRNTTVLGDVDGDRNADFSIQLAGSYVLTANDFVR